ncbi:MAG: NAD(P)H-binding protein, partial [bacterium]|nr:NAD(P)H-binding protein [bacterium]
MLVFLTGATGYVGNEVLRLLLDRGHRVVALTRSRGWLAPARGGVDALLGDLGTPQGWEEAAAAADAIVHCALEYTVGGDERPEVDAVALSAYERAVGDGGKPLVYTSSLFECSRGGTGPIIESTPQENRDRWRLRHERRILETIPGAAVLRLGFVYGGTGGYIWDLFA